MPRDTYSLQRWPVLFSAAFEEEFSVLAEPVKVELLARARLLEQFGPQLGRPAVDTLKGSRFVNMKELRFDADRGVWRVAFAFDPARRAILLVAGDKAGVGESQFYRSLIARADRRFDTHLRGLSVEDRQAKGVSTMSRTLEEMLKMLPASQREAVERRTNELVAEEMGLRELRKALDLTQASVAKKLRKGQDRVSRIENTDDILLSSLRDYVRSLGGELELVCRFKDRQPVLLRMGNSVRPLPSSRRKR